MDAPQRGTASERLGRKIEAVTPAFAEACARLFRHPRLADAYPEYLIGKHFVMRATVPLMEAAVAEASGLAGRGDPVAAGVATYLAKHIEEERDHDEWVLQDLELIGVDRAGVLARVPPPTPAALVGVQYYWVRHYHPVALLGFFAFAEGFPPGPELIRELEERSGYPAGAFRTLAKHGDLDPAHGADIAETIDSVPLSPAQEAALGLSAMTTARLTATWMHEVADDVDAMA